MHASSQPGLGSTFWFEMPLQPGLGAGGDTATATAFDAETRQARPRPALVLVAEDNAVNSLVVQAMLEHQGMTVLVAMDGAQTVAAVEQQPVDLVLMDCQMPLMDGYEATQRIRSSGHARARVPIVALTANALAEDRQRCEAVGMNDYLSKPVTGESLACVLLRFLGPADDEAAGARVVSVVGGSTRARPAEPGSSSRAGDVP